RRRRPVQITLLSSPDDKQKKEQVSRGRFLCKLQLLLCNRSPDQDVKKTCAGIEALGIAEMRPKYQSTHLPNRKTGIVFGNPADFAHQILRSVTEEPKGNSIASLDGSSRLLPIRQ